MVRCSIWRLVVLALLICSAPGRADPPPILGVETLFRNPEKTDFTLSPDGESVAFLAPWQDRMNLWVQRVGEDTARARGVDVPYMVMGNEGHGFRNEENRVAFHRALEQFLGKYLGGRVAPGPDVLGGLKG